MQGPHIHLNLHSGRDQTPNSLCFAILSLSRHLVASSGHRSHQMSLTGHQHTCFRVYASSHDRAFQHALISAHHRAEMPLHAYCIQGTPTISWIDSGDTHSERTHARTHHVTRADAVTDVFGSPLLWRAKRRQSCACTRSETRQSRAASPRSIPFQRHLPCRCARNADLYANEHVCLERTV